MKNLLKNLLKMSIVLASALLVGTLLLMGAFTIPTDRMVQKVGESAEMFESPSSDSNIIAGYPFTLTGWFTDCIMLYTAVYDGDSHSLAERALMAYRLEYSEDNWNPNDALLAYLRDDPFPCEVSYARYWHGYLVLLKPMLLLMNIGELKLFNTIMFAVACLIMLWGFYKRSFMPQGIALMIALLFMMPLSIMVSFSLSVPFYIMSAGVFVQLFWGHKFKKNSYLYFFLVLGIATAYFDFLSYPLVTLGIPLTVWLMLKEDDRVLSGKKRLISSVSSLMLNCFSWAMGYAGMWVGKWIISDVLLDNHVVLDAKNTLYVRAGLGDASRFHQFLSSLIQNTNPYKDVNLRLFFFLLLLFAVYLFFKNRNALKVDSSRLVCYCIIMLLPFGWFFAATNHSIIHWIFTFRILGITLFSLMILFLDITGQVLSKTSTKFAVCSENGDYYDRNFE